MKSAKQAIHIKCQAWFYLKKENEEKTPRNAFVIHALRVQPFLI